MSRVWMAPRYGGPEVLELREEAERAPGPGELAVRVVAIGVNPADAKLVAGQRSADPEALPIVPGFELSGVVEAVGSGAPFSPGDRIVAFRVFGAYRERAVVPARNAFVVPPALGMAEAAGLLLAATAAAAGLHHVQAGRGDVILVHGMSGVVGESVLHQAAVIGAQVVGGARVEDHERLRALGAIPLVTVTTESVLAATGHVDASLDLVGAPELTAVSVALVPAARRVALVGSPDPETPVVSSLSPETNAYRDSMRGPLIELAASGAHPVRIGMRVPFEEAPAAMARSVERPSPGTIVIETHATV